ncbi:MAG: response regulator [Rhizobiaceae bacterium]
MRAVIVVEDEALVAINLEDMLIELGYEVLGPAMRLEAAMKLVETGASADAAILDVNLAGAPVFPVAALLAERGVPIVFATGYGVAGLPEPWRGHPVLQKPYTLEEVAAALAKAVAGGGA